jgi:hypothetical protein
MKYTLTTDDKEEFELWYKGPNARYTIDGLYEWIRSELKYNPNLKSTEAKMLEKFRDKINELERDV